MFSFLGATDCSISVEKVAGENVYRALEGAARRFIKVNVINVNDIVCPGGYCSATEQDGVVFRDAQHLTDSFVRKIAPVVLKRMELSDFSSQMSRDR
jgi:hypothetical protein